LSKPRCWCEQLGIRAWWRTQLFHIRQLIERWCDRGMKGVDHTGEFKHHSLMSPIEIM
jgi:hypothetical protein